MDTNTDHQNWEKEIMLCIGEAQVQKHIQMVHLVDMFLTDSDGISRWFPHSRCLRNINCYFLTCPHCYYLNDYIRFWQLSADADRHLCLTCFLPKTIMDIHPKTYLSSCFACSGFFCSKNGRETDWDSEERERKRREKRDREQYTRLSYFAFCWGNPVLTHGEYHLPFPVVPYLDSTCQTDIWNMNSSAQWIAPQRQILVLFYEKQVSGKAVSTRAALGVQSPVHLAATRCKGRDTALW